jgi:hypothetical protein
MSYRRARRREGEREREERREREREHTCCVLVDDPRDGELSQIVNAMEAVIIIPSHRQNFRLGNYIRRLHCRTICRGGQ